MNDANHFMARALALAKQNIAIRAGGPFGAVVVKNGQIIAESYNRVLEARDPTAHAEMCAIRIACDSLQSYHLTGCIIYTSCEPCPMCLGAIYWAQLDSIYYAATREDAQQIGFSDAHIYSEFNKPMMQQKIPIYQVARPVALQVFEDWLKSDQKILY